MIVMCLVSMFVYEKLSPAQHVRGVSVRLTTIHIATCSRGPPIRRVAFFFFCEQGKRATPAKKCHHNINQPPQSSRNN